MNLRWISVLIVLVIELFNFGADGEKVCSCYIFENGTSSAFGWLQAKDSCKYNNKHLVVLETEREWEFIKKEIQTRTTFQYINEWYIGLYRNLTGIWTWINGKPLTIDKWQRGRPTDRDSYTLIAKEYPPGHKGSFNSIPGSILNRGWICEEETDNCQGVCFFHKIKAVPTNSTPPETTTSTQQMKTSTAYDHTNVSDSTTTTSVSGVSGQNRGDENCSTIVIITTSLAAVFFVVVVILSVVLLLILRRTKRYQKVDNRVLYTKPSSLGQQSTDGVQLESSAEHVVYVPRSRTEAGLATYEALNDRRHDCAYATLEKTNHTCVPSEQSDDGYCVPLEQ